MNAQENQLAHILNAQYVRCRQTSGLLIVEVVIANVTSQQKSQIWANAPQSIQQVYGGNAMIWKVYIYANHDDRFTANGTLHTIPSSREDGCHTVTLSADDCFANITEFDSELLQMGPPNGHIVYAKESIDEQGHPILPHQARVNYLWLEAVGGEYQIVTNGVRAITQAHPFQLEIFLR